MLVLIGASASGKTEIAKYLIQHNNMKKIVTYTTRLKREHEIDHIDYHFISLGDFLQKKEHGFFIETSLYNNHYYGTAFQDVTDDSVLIVDINGANFIYNKQLKNTVFMFLKASKEVRKKRMLMRNDSITKIHERLQCDDLTFRTENLNHIDNIIDTNNKTIKELANEIYELYMKKIKEI